MLYTCQKAASLANLAAGRILAEICPTPEATARLPATVRAQGKSYFCRPKLVHKRKMVKKFLKKFVLCIHLPIQGRLG